MQPSWRRTLPITPTCVAFGRDEQRSYAGDAEGRVHRCYGPRALPTFQSHGAAVVSLLEVDLVDAARPGFALGDAMGRVLVVHEGQVVAEHLLPCAVTALAVHRPRPGCVALAAADAGGTVVLFRMHETCWKLQLRQVISGAEPFASALVSLSTCPPTDAAQPLLAAVGPESLALIGEGRVVDTSRAPGVVTALCHGELLLGGGDASAVSAASTSAPARRHAVLLACADGWLHVYGGGGGGSGGSSGTPFEAYARTGLHITRMALLMARGSGGGGGGGGGGVGGGETVACAGQFNGVVLVHARKLQRHVLVEVGWVAGLSLCAPSADDAPAAADAAAAPAGTLLVASDQGELSAWQVAPLLDAAACGG